MLKFEKWDFKWICEKEFMKYYDENINFLFMKRITSHYCELISYISKAVTVALMS